jgi:hypothetical protein
MVWADSIPSLDYQYPIKKVIFLSKKPGKIIGEANKKVEPSLIDKKGMPELGMKNDTGEMPRDIISKALAAGKEGSPVTGGKKKTLDRDTRRKETFSSKNTDAGSSKKFYKRKTF